MKRLRIIKLKLTRDLILDFRQKDLNSNDGAPITDLTFLKVRDEIWKFEKWYTFYKVFTFITTVALTLFFLLGCSSAKMAVRHEKRSQKQHQKALDKNLVVKEVRRVPDAYMLDTNAVGKPYLRPIYYDCPPYSEFIFPKTNTQIRQEERTKRRESKDERRMHNSDNRNETKQNKSDNKLEAKLAKENRKLKETLGKYTKRLEVAKARFAKQEKSFWRWIWWILVIGITIGVFLSIFLKRIWKRLISFVTFVSLIVLSVYSNSH